MHLCFFNWLFLTLIRRSLHFSCRYFIFSFRSQSCSAMPEIYQRDGVVVRASVSQSIDLGFISLVESYQKILKYGIHSFHAWRSAYKKIVWRTSGQACLLCPWARHITGRFHLYVTDRWPTRTSPGYNCEVAHPACCNKLLLGTHQKAVRIVGGGATSHS